MSTTHLPQRSIYHQHFEEINPTHTEPMQTPRAVSPSAVNASNERPQPRAVTTPASPSYTSAQGVTLTSVASMLLHGSIQRRGDLVQHLKNACTLQVDQALTTGTSPEVFTKGDLALRNTIRSLLSPEETRELFFYVASRYQGMRIRALFGAPPYSFLCDGEAALVDVASISRGRVNMAFDTQVQSYIPSYNDFGAAMCVDQHNREYRLLNHGNGDNLSGMTLVLGIDAIKLDMTRSFQGTSELLCKLPKANSRSKRKREGQIDSQQQQPKEVDTPMPGDLLRLKPSKKLQDLHEKGVVLEVRVTRALKRSIHASTAAVTVRWS